MEDEIPAAAPCSRTTPEQVDWEVDYTAVLLFIFLNKVQLLNSILCVCMTASFIHLHTKFLNVYWMNLEGLGAAEIYTSFSTKTSSAPGKFYAIWCHQKNHIQLWWMIES